MPQDQQRRNSRKLTSEDDVEVKRARGEISCAECRRYVFSTPSFPQRVSPRLATWFPFARGFPFLNLFHNLSFPTSAHVRVRRGAHAPRQAETQMRQEDPLRQLRAQRMHVHMSKRCVQISRLPVWGRVLFVLCYHRARLTRRHRIVHLGANNFFHRKPLCRPRHKVRACFPPCARAQTSLGLLMRLRVVAAAAAEMMSGVWLTPFGFGLARSLGPDLRLRLRLASRAYLGSSSRTRSSCIARSPR